MTDAGVSECLCLYQQTFHPRIFFSINHVGWTTLDRALFSGFYFAGGNTTPDPWAHLLAEGTLQNTVF